MLPLEPTPEMLKAAAETVRLSKRCGDVPHPLISEDEARRVYAAMREEYGKTATTSSTIGEAMSKLHSRRWPNMYALAFGMVSGRFSEWPALKHEALSCLLAAERYEYLRTLTPQQFQKLYMRCVSDDVPFDTLVDRALVERRQG